MSPPEVWGPAVWTLFHTLAEKIDENAYPHLVNSLFNVIVRICKFLPCPECAKDASNFLAKINIKEINKKELEELVKDLSSKLKSKSPAKSAKSGDDKSKKETKSENKSKSTKKISK